MSEYLVVLAGLGVLWRAAPDVLWLFLPLLAANQMGYVNNLNLPGGRVPVSAHLLGSNKTLGAYYGGPVLGFVAVTILWMFAPELSTHFGATRWGTLRGFAVGLGVVLGDQTNSFLKRRLGLSPGSPFFLDRVDWALLGVVAERLVLHNVTFTEMAEVVFVAAGVHFLGNRNSYRFGWRRTKY